MCSNGSPLAFFSELSTIESEWKSFSLTASFNIYAGLTSIGHGRLYIRNSLVQVGVLLLDPGVISHAHLSLMLSLAQRQRFDYPSA